MKIVSFLLFRKASCAFTWSASIFLSLKSIPYSFFSAGWCRTGSHNPQWASDPGLPDPSCRHERAGRQPRIWDEVNESYSCLLGRQWDDKNLDPTEASLPPKDEMCPRSVCSQHREGNEGGHRGGGKGVRRKRKLCMLSLLGILVPAFLRPGSCPALRRWR